MLVVTTDLVPGRTIAEPLGLVQGATVRARHVGADVVAAFRNLVGGEIHEHARLLAQARNEARDRMVAEARALGADAVVAVRFATATIGPGAAEVLCYGTAIRLE